MSKRTFERPTPAEVAASVNRAIAEGRHSPTHQTVCQGCGQWVFAIWHVTEDGRRLCCDCAPATLFTAKPLPKPMKAQ